MTGTSGRAPKSLHDGIKVANYVLGAGFGTLVGSQGVGFFQDGLLLTFSVLAILSGALLKIAMEREVRRYAL